MSLLDPSMVAEPSSDDGILEVFLDHLVQTKVEPYSHQEQAILEWFSGRNVILNTPTGSGKTLVALAVHFRAICRKRRSFYTVPIKALANEKFLWLCRMFGAENVGMMTGDATVNREAPVICCTAEILANIALREGAGAPVDDVVMDEFHYYADAERGGAWQIPLLTLPRARFLLMSATLGGTAFFERALHELTGVETVLVSSDERPVPLEFEFSEIPLQEKLAELAEQGKAPVYLVHFTQLACARTAQDLLSTNFCSKEEKQAIAELLREADFGSPYGKEIARLLRHGIGIHHAGLLPKYRVLVEKLTQLGLLKVVCGTDTLGVGVNVPIRTVVFTRLFKYDGTSTRILSVRDFKQIAGRAGRRGFDTAGTVVAQAPEHVIENLRLERKATASGKKSFVKRKPPDGGFVMWDERTFRRLIESPPERLTSSFRITHSMLLNVLGRSNEDGCRALRKLINDTHEPPARRKAMRRRAFQLFRGLVEGGVLGIIPPEMRGGPVKVALNVALQEDFAINQALGPYLLHAIPRLDPASPDYALNVISLVEAIIEDPDVILRRQVDLLKGELLARLKNEGVPFEKRMELLEEVEWPKPGREFIYETYRTFVAGAPWLKDSNVRPKCIVREMFEHWQSFGDYVKTYGLERSEGVLLRHLSEVYRVLSQTVPPMAKNDELMEAEAYLEAIIRGVDSSLLDEWERLRDPEMLEERRQVSAPRPLVISRSRASTVRVVRNAVFAFLKPLALGDTAGAIARLAPAEAGGISWTMESLEAELDPYFHGHERIRLDPEARAMEHTRIVEEHPRRWLVEQTLVDPDELNDWQLRFLVDPGQAESSSPPVIQLMAIGPI